MIAQSEPMEVVAVLAHELGHWANWDTTRQLLIAEVLLLHRGNVNSRYTCFRFSLLSQLSLRMGVCIVRSGLWINLH